MMELLIPFVAAVVSAVIVLAIGFDFRFMLPGGLILVLAMLAFGILQVLVVYNTSGDIEAATAISDSSIESALDSLPNLVIGEIFGGVVGAIARPVAWAIGIRI